MKNSATHILSYSGAHERRWMMSICLSVVVVSGLISVAQAQPAMSERDIRSRLDAIYAGKAAEVRSELPSLLSRYPNDAGVRYIQAVLTPDGATAAKRYEEIAQKFPQSVWADHALYKLYQYQFSIGLYKKADSVMTQLRTAYPHSIYVQSQNGATPSVPATTPEASTGGVKKEDTGRAKKQDTQIDTRQQHPGAPAASRQTEPAAAKKPADTAAVKKTVPAAAVKKQVETPEKKSQPSSAPAAPTAKTDQNSAGSYSVQAGLFSSEANAKRAAEQYSTLAGRQARVVTKTTNEKTFYLVFFDGFATRESAQSFSAELRTKHQIDSFVSPR